MQAGTTFHFATVHVAIAPTLLGAREHLLGGIDLPALGYERTAHVTTPAATHFVLTRRPT
jgi:hypothetical protein